MEEERGEKEEGGREREGGRREQLLRYMYAYVVTLASN